MGMTPSNNDGDLNFEINVTPLVDVVLVLLIIFMVVVPLTMRGYEVDVPSKVKAVSNEPLPPQPDAVVMSITMQTCPLTAPLKASALPERCSVRIGEKLIAMRNLSAELSTIYQDRVTAQERTLFLDAEDRLNYEGVMRVLDVAYTSVPDLRVGLWTDVMEMANVQ